MSIRMAFMPANNDGCALYRMFMPHLYVPLAKYLYTGGPIKLDDCADVNVAVVQRLVTDKNYDTLVKMRGMGLKVIYDLDDDLWALQSANPAKQQLDPVLDSFKVCADICNIMTVSTDRIQSALRTAFKQWDNSDRVVVVKNAIDFRLFQRVNRNRPDDKVVVGWGGSNTHAGDIGAAWKAVEELLPEEPMMHFEVIGHEPPRKIATHPRVKVRQWVPTSEYPARFSSWSWDIALAPLDNNRFNRSKSNIKMLEAAAIEAPCLVSDVEPYREFIDRADGRLDYLICSSVQQWKDKIKELIHNVPKRQYLAKEMYNIAKVYFNVSVNATQWLRVAERVMEQK